MKARFWRPIPSLLRQSKAGVSLYPLWIGNPYTLFFKGADAGFNPRFSGHLSFDLGNLHVEKEQGWRWQG